MIKTSDYNKAHNALFTLQSVGKVDGELIIPLADNEYDDYFGKINICRTAQELTLLTSEIKSYIKVNKHDSKAKMLEFALSKGYRPLQSDDNVNDPLQLYIYQLPSGYYRTVYLVKAVI